jgi:hypothetical protein
MNSVGDRFCRITTLHQGGVMNKTLVTMVAFLAVLSARSASAQFTGSRSGHHGSLCQLDRTSSAQGTRADYSARFGVYNATSGTIAVVCPVQPLEIGALEFSAVVYDRHYADPVSCTLRLIASNGNVLFEETRKTSDYGYNWSPNAIELDWRLPYSSYWYRYGSLHCFLPPTGNSVSAGFSHVASYHFD